MLAHFLPYIIQYDGRPLNQILNIKNNKELNNHKFIIKFHPNYGENFIKKYSKYINDKFEFIRDPETTYVEIVINNNSKITILPGSNWKEIKRHIDKKIIVQRNGISEGCIICYEKIRNNVTCPKCSNNYCGECYINLFKKGKGVITCPHCRYSIGNTMSE